MRGRKGPGSERELNDRRSANICSLERLADDKLSVARRVRYPDDEFTLRKFVERNHVE